jgi:hypothetical protein
MSKLFKLKEWLTLNEAAAHISNVLGEPATVADLLRFTLDGHLTLSVDFVNHTQAQKGKRVKTDEVEFVKGEQHPFTGEKLDIPYEFPKHCEDRVSEDDWLRFEESVVSIEGVWDLPMIGAESLDVEHCYQQLTSGPEVTLVVLDGALVERGDVICKLQESYDDNEYQEGSKAQLQNIENYIATKKVNEEKAEKLRAEHKAERDKYLESKKNKPKENDYYPAGGLPKDCVFVIRTKEITRFIQSLEDNPVPEKPLTSKERNSLLVLIGALCKEFGIDPIERGAATPLVAMTETLGAPLTGDTIRKILNQIENAVDLRSK